MCLLGAATCASPPIAHRSSPRAATPSSRTRAAATSGRSAATNLELVVGFDASRDADAAAPLQPGHRPRAGHHAGAGIQHHRRRRAHHAHLERRRQPSSARLAEATDHGVTLTFTFEHRAQRLLFTRVYACYPGSPTIETWTRIASTGGDGTALTDLVAWQMTMPLGNVRWLGGLRGDSANSDGASEDAFVFAEHDFEPGERLDLGADGRSSEKFVPFFLVDDGRDEFYGGLMWSGAWRASLERADERLRVTRLVSRRRHDRHRRPGRSSCRTRSSASPRRRPATRPARCASSCCRASATAGRFSRSSPTTPGSSTARASTKTRWSRRSIARRRSASSCSSWTPAGISAPARRATSTSTAGLGSWTADPDRFPSGLASLADYAHGVGMKFGLWVEPERVSLATVDKPGLAQEAVAGDARQRLRLGAQRADLSRRRGRTQVGAGPARRADRSRASRLSEVGQQLLDQLRPRRPRPRRRRRQHGARAGALRHPRRAAPPLPGSADRERVRRRRPPRLRDDGLHRHGVDGRPHRRRRRTSATTSKG